jgi:hypothetical protein|tara:strand:- start:126 stop:1007 length:882 start_codon:yes stop_codon:yes gene_type:complete
MNEKILKYKGVEPIPNSEISEFLEGIDYSKWMRRDSDWVFDKYKNVFYDWIQQSNRNHLKGLEEFTHKKYCYGSTQSFDLFYIQNKDKRFRMLKGDFFYHKACLSKGFKWKYLEDDLQEGDALIISVPFSDTGKTPEDLENILLNCDELNIPVLLDMCYYTIGKNINIDLTHPCIDTISFSLSKFADGVQHFRCGLRLSRTNRDDGIDLINEYQQISKISCVVGLYIMDNYHVDYNWDKFETSYNLVCKEKDFEPSDTIVIGLGGSDYDELNRGNSKNRVCVANDVWEKYNGI